jgi:hypothetical protein
MNKHKDLPSGSQAWADEVDRLLEENKQLKEVVRRLCENAGLDFSNPQRGLNPVRDIPSNANPVGQKLSSLSDVQTYNVADKQVLNWSQKDQKWLPVTLPEPSAGGFFPIPMSYQSNIVGFGDITSTGPVWNGTDFEDRPIYAYFGHTTNGGAEMWGRRSVYIGAGDPYDSPNTGYTYFEQQFWNGDSYTAIESVSYKYSGARLIVSGSAIRLQYAPFYLERFATASRPTLGIEDKGALIFDADLNLPIMWNGTQWVNLIGTAV